MCLSVEVEGRWSKVNPWMFTCTLCPVNGLDASSLDVPLEEIPCSQSWFESYPTGHLVQCTRPAGQVTVEICVSYDSVYTV